MKLTSTNNPIGLIVLITNVHLLKQEHVDKVKQCIRANVIYQTWFGIYVPGSWCRLSVLFWKKYLSLIRMYQWQAQYALHMQSFGDQ